MALRPGALAGDLPGAGEEPCPPAHTPRTTLTAMNPSISGELERWTVCLHRLRKGFHFVYKNV